MHVRDSVNSLEHNFKIANLPLNLLETDYATRGVLLK